MWQHEPCFFGWLKGRKPARCAGDYPPSVWELPTVPAGEHTDHPTSKPVELFAILMRQPTRPGEVCYEPFAGSGSQYVAGEGLGRLVYGCEMANATTPDITIDNDEIYRGIRILGRQIGTQGTDWALVQIDRPVLNRPYVRIRRSGKIPDGAAVHVIGHPCGLPKKYAGGAVVRDNTPSPYFVANTDTYGGNSGSPVFNHATHEVEGILVRGETDFVWNGNCRVSNVCPANGCRGEDCTRTTEFVSLVPRNEHDFIPFNPQKAKVMNVRRRWKIVVDGMWLLDFGSIKKEADQALKVIKHYGLNNQCFVGRPHPSMEFYLADGQAPEGPMAGEDTIPFNPAAVEVQYVRGRWKVVEGNHWIMDFDQAEAEARQALSYILRYGFRYICFVGRPDPSMTYFRK
jgi:hypothetical protein